MHTDTDTLNIGRIFFIYDSLSLQGSLAGTVLVILKFLKIKVLTCIISFYILWDELSEIFLQIELSS